MTLRKKTILIIGIMLLLLMGVLYLTLSRIISTGFAKFEQQEAIEDIGRITDGFSEEISKVDNLAQDWAVWDDSYTFISDRNDEFIQSNLNNETIIRNKMNFVLYIDASFDLVFGKYIDPKTEKESPLLPSLKSFISPNNVLLQQDNPEKHIEGVLALSEGFFLVSFHPILTSEGKGPARGTLVFGKFLNQGVLDHLAKKTHLPVTVYRYDDSQIPATIRNDLGKSGKEWGVVPLDSERLAGYTLVRDVYGNPALILRTIIPRDAYAQSRSILDFFMVALIGVGLILIVATLLLLEKTILSRLGLLSSEVQGISQFRDLSLRVHARGNDELAILGKNVNKMLESLEGSGRALQESRENFQLLLHSTAEAIYGLDLDGNCTFANSACLKLLGLENEQNLIGKDMHALIHHKHSDGSPYPRECCAIYSALKHGQGIHLNDDVFWHSDGTSFPVEYWCYPICRSGVKVGVVVTFFNISERKKIEQMKNEFVSMVSHELRTPLTSIRGSLGLISSGMIGKMPTQAKTLVDIAVNNCERLVRLINDILDIEKIDSGKMDFEMKPMFLTTLIEQATEHNRAFLEEYQVRLNIENPVPEIQVSGDSDKLQQILTNLISNAAKFSHSGEEVKISVSRHDGWVRLSVIDRGLGIPEAFKARLFEKFAQVDTSDCRKRGGTGLGLSISKALVEKHGGKLGYEPNPEGGSIFYFDLLELRKSENFALPPPSECSRILICEDERDIADILALLFQKKGYQTDIAHSGAQALRLLGKNRYAAMTLDLMLHDQNGLLLLRKLRKLPDTRRLPVIVISATSEETQKELGEEDFHLVEWVQKPVDPDRILKLLNATGQHNPEDQPPAGLKPKNPHASTLSSFT